MLALLITGSKAWRVFFAFLVLPCLIGTEAAREVRGQGPNALGLADVQPSAVHYSVLQQPLLRYADLSHPISYGDPLVFYTAFFNSRILRQSFIQQPLVLSARLQSVTYILSIRAPPSVIA